MTPDLDSLRCFVAAAEAPSFRRAAARVGLSPAAFSERIARLEELLGAALFARTTRKLDLTPAGHRLLAPARAALAAADACAAAVHPDAGPAPVRVRLGTRFELGLSFIVPALDALRAARPERRIDLYFGESDGLLDRLADGRLDAVLTSVRLDRAGFATAPLHEEAYAFCAAPALLDAAPLRGPADAAAHRLADTQPDLPLFRYFRDARPPDEVWAFGDVEHMGTIAAVRARLLAGRAVGVLPRYFVEPDLAAGRLAALFPETVLPTDRFRLIWRADDPLADALHALADALRQRPLT